MNSNPVKFNGTAGGYFVATLVSILTYYIIIFGWPIGFNFVAGWVVDNLEVEGKKMKYSAGYGETLGFLLVNILLIVVTLGIYSFWFIPKSYRFILEHSTYLGEATVSAPAPEVASSPAPAATPEVSSTNDVTPPTPPMVQ
jgi:uncharacterized membrane protein YjgN (DUF898 family)